MKKNARPIILVADDNKEDYMLAKEAFKEVGISDLLLWVKNGEELMEYLLLKGKYKNSKDAPAPSVILLDLNMPKKDGRETLKEIKGHQTLRKIPVIIFTVSGAEEDINYCYKTGANSYVRKPINFNQLVDIFGTIKKYWLETVELP